MDLSCGLLSKSAVPAQTHNARSRKSMHRKRYNRASGCFTMLCAKLQFTCGKPLDDTMLLIGSIAAFSDRPTISTNYGIACCLS